jgi:uncharacterized membrane protein (UPF0136 family)
MNVIVGQAALFVYALLLAAGGTLGYVKAKSRPSLIAGVTSGVLAALCALVAGVRPALGLWLGAILALLLFGLFGVRFAKSRKMMPSGLMGAISGIVLLLLAIMAFRLSP